ncbi:MAG: hypothetical protein HY841_05875 [Bacteroidetes bacterium]|nr:hypothetical protein [Bacteroidota bacterium]
MSSIELELYELLKVKLGEKEAKTLVTFIEAEVKEEIEKEKKNLLSHEDKEKLLTKADALTIFATKADFEKLRAELLLVKWMLGFVLAGILALIVKTFF